ncbi:hypothetical protein E1B28_011402 [Marasmius oreades]|uniref:NmrA-like domain-containing protein n=1 Tax=Marasmius oreades TaxID=181124 RepID=A0A9P7UPY0_9AGAR|nr:uncharacterized protein E1B28_011402 [Marasmius oreades]KAG7089748.1 hypothetical protein E1B28_011402 [Marasmius oreades]
MSAKVKVLVTGVTGYIGGAVVDRFLARPDASSFDIRAIVRSAEKGEKLKAFGITPIVGSHNDEKVTVKAASEVDVVITMANVDDLEAAKAVLEGLKKRFEETGKPPLLIHTSGTGVLSDDAAGKHQTDTVYDDKNPNQIESLAPTQMHRNVDLEVVAADNEGNVVTNTRTFALIFMNFNVSAIGYIKSYIILPSTIYSIAEGPLFRAGISRPHSQQVPALIRASLDRKQAGIVGDGVNLWPNVDILELADLYSILYDSATKNPDQTGHGREGFYFGVNGEHRLYDVGKAIGEALVDLGITKTPEPTTFTQQEIEKYFQASHSEEISRPVIPT